jgi:hypothetical protein
MAYYYILESQVLLLTIISKGVYLQKIMNNVIFLYYQTVILLI